MHPHRARIRHFFSDNMDFFRYGSFSRIPNFGLVIGYATVLRLGLFVG